MAASDRLSLTVNFAVREPSPLEDALEWLSANENALMLELTSSFTLTFYWIQDLRLPIDADAAFEVFLEILSEQQFIATLHARATLAGVQIKAPTQELFLSPRIGPYYN